LPRHAERSWSYKKKVARIMVDAWKLVNLMETGNVRHNIEGSRGWSATDNEPITIGAVIIARSATLISDGNDGAERKGIASYE
jgi:hypothetical protein